MPQANPEDSLEHLDQRVGPLSPASLEGEGFYRRIGKRLTDILFSGVGLVLLSPIFLLVALLQKLTSRGPVFYTQERLGQGGKVFRIVKFRSMRVGGDGMGPPITWSGDPRVTPLGLFLRRYKIDELPQLWNVLKGEMSLVGPRPELPMYLAGYSPQQRRVLAVRPGITDLASLRYRNEEVLLQESSTPEQYYRTVLLPQKLALNLAYLETVSFAQDVSLILQTVRALFVSSPREG